MSDADNLPQFKTIYATLTDGIPGKKKRGEVLQLLMDIRDYGKAIWTDKKNGLPGIADAVMNHKVPWYGYDGKVQPPGGRNTVTLASVIGWLDSGITTISTQNRENGEKLDKLLKLLEEK